MKQISILLLIIILCNCKGVKRNKFDSITGVAHHAKVGAYVLVDNKIIYHLYDKHRWDKKYLDKEVTVKGYFFVQNMKYKDKNNPFDKYRQRYVSGKRAVILGPQWKLISEDESKWEEIK